MNKISKIKVGIIAIVSTFLIGVLLLSIHYENLDLYTQDSNEVILSENGEMYEFDWELTNRYAKGELKTVQVIGRFEGENIFETYLLGPRIYKLKDYDEEDVFLVRGIMLQQVYSKKE